ncbi:IS256 family transposase [Flindersiella endophytica]
MTDTTEFIAEEPAANAGMIGDVASEEIDEKELAERLLVQARERGVSLVGPGGLLSSLTKTVLETFEPAIVKKRQRRLNGIDEIVLSLTARGLTTGEVAAHFEDVYGAKVSKDTISRITEKVVGERAEWSCRPLDAIYPVIFVDALVVKVREGQVRNTPFYVVMGVTTAGERDILGIWAGSQGGEGARFWLQVFSELKNRGVADVLIAVCDGLKGAAGGDLHHLGTHRGPAVRGAPDPQQLPLRRPPASRRDRQGAQPVYTAPSEAAAKERFNEFADQWGTRYPAIVRLWENAWAEFVPFLEYHLEIRKVICTTNAIESINARYRRAVKARGHFPTDAAALKCLYLVTRSLDPTGGGRARWMMRWKAPLNAFAITFTGRFEPTNH